MKAVILAAGKGIRLRPLTYGIPKTLLPIGGRPIIDWVIDNLTACKKIDKIYVAVSGATSDDFEDRILSHTHGICVDSYLKKKYGNMIETVPTPQRETAGDLKFILNEKGIRKGKVAVAYGDNLTRINMEKFLQYHEKSRNMLGTLATLLLFSVPKEESRRFGIVKTKDVNGINIITSYVEKPKNPSSNLAHAGYYILELDELFHEIPHDKAKIESSLFPTLVRNGKFSGFVDSIPFWFDIGTTEAYREANRRFPEIQP